MMKLVNILRESIQYKIQFESSDKKMVEDFVSFIKKELSIKEDIDIILQNEANIVSNRTATAPPLEPR